MAFSENLARWCISDEPTVSRKHNPCVALGWAQGQDGHVRSSHQQSMEQGAKIEPTSPLREHGSCAMRLSFSGENNASGGLT
jgi:hypothetical protein